MVLTKKYCIKDENRKIDYVYIDAISSGKIHYYLVYYFRKNYAISYKTKFWLKRLK